MKTFANPDRYLERRGRVWYYVRRVPSSVQQIEGRTRVKSCLSTRDIAIARERRDKQVAADEAYWDTLKPKPGVKARKPLKARRRGVQAEVLDELANVKAMLGQVLHMLAEERASSGRERGTSFDPPALAATRPDMRLSEAFVLYCSEIAIDEAAGKSPEQRSNWEKTKLRSVQCFIDINGDLGMRAITRDHARALHRHWAARILPTSGPPTAKGNTGKRVMGDLLAIAERLAGRNVKLQYGETVHDPEDPMGNMIFHMRGAYAQLERQINSARTKRALAQPHVRAKMKGKKPTLSPAQDKEIRVLHDRDPDRCPWLRAHMRQALRIARTARSFRTK